MQLPLMFSSLGVRNYRLWAGGQVVSLTGTWMQRIAQDWLVLQLSGGSGVAVGIVMALQFGPTAILSLPAGALADRFDKRKLLIGTQVAMALCALILGVIDVSGAANLPLVYALSFALGCISAVDAPVRQSFTIEMVGVEQLPNAVALNSLTFNLARIVGPALAGLLITLIDTGPVFLINAGSSIAVIIALLAMRSSELMRSARSVRDRSIRSGIRYVRRHRHLVVVLATVFMVATFGLNFPLSLALLTANTFEGSAGGYGLLSTMLAVGTLGGALIAARRTRPARVRQFLVGAFLFGILEVVVGFMPTFWLVAAMLIPVGMANIMFSTAAMNIMQLSVESDMRGRVMGIYMICFLGGTPIGSPLLGWLAEVTDPRAPLIIGGVISAISAAFCAILLLRSTHQRPGLDHGKLVLTATGE
ncbi:putative MFS family arabinose efflux permease [Williamsia limnetica]|jgi:MFS family permease|uniref:Putative MFS family arabinose efflux permease n=2 Tax=Williamsia limnetica TaxID=882452 RepID=A0A318RRN9_WILLI|nr:MFS transporter [Williamsia limnetica]PYE14941.1 putative MFS family arabinose efflux permease [Williamsia limnetica]